MSSIKRNSGKYVIDNLGELEGEGKIEEDGKFL
jgi:hypothetical protein